MGKEQVSRRRDFQQDTGRDRLRQCRLDRGGPGDRPEDESDRLRSVFVRRARARSWRGEGRARRVVAPRRLHHAAHAADRPDPQHHQRGDAEADQKGRAADQLRARRTHRRSGFGGGAEVRPCRRRGDRRVRRRAGDAKPAVRLAQRSLHAAPRRFDAGGAGERRAPGRRANVGLSAPRRHFQRRQLSVDQCRRSAEAEAVRGAGGKARFVRGPAHRDRSPALPDHLRRAWWRR